MVEKFDKNQTEDNTEIDPTGGALAPLIAT